MSQPLRLGIAGLGLIGGSIAAAARQRGLCSEVLAWDRNPGSLVAGLEQQVIDTGVGSVKELADCDLLVVCTPVAAIADIFAELVGFTGILTDVGSVKAPVLAAAAQAFGDIPTQLVPGHPIAGSEKHGVAAANPDLFAARRVILTPTDETDSEAIERVRQFWEGLGASVTVMDALHHDHVLAQTSHLPHLLAFALVDLLAAQDDSLEIFEYAAGGFRDFSRIAASDPVMWRDIFVANREQVLAILDGYVAELADLRVMLEAGDGEALRTLFGRAKAARDHFSRLPNGKAPGQ